MISAILARLTTALTGAGQARLFDMSAPCLACGLLALSGAFRSAPAQEAQRPFIFAHYMHCYVLGAISPADVRVRDPGRIQDLTHWPQIEQESEWFAPALSATAASGAIATAKDFDAAENAGVDAFGLLLGTKMLPRSAFSGGLNLLASVAERRKVKIIPELWANPWSDDYKLFGQHVRAFMEAHPNAFQRWNGKPMFVLELDGFAKHYGSSDQEQALSKLDDLFAPWGGLSSVYIIVYIPYDLKQTVSSSLIAKADALGIWTPQDDWSALHSHIVGDAGRALHKDVAWPVAPAFYQRRAGGKPMEYGNSFGAARFIDAWGSALAASPEFIDLQTWNDFSEDTAVVPTNTDGGTLLSLTGYFAKWAKTGAQPPVGDETAMLFRPKQLTNATLQDPASLITNAAWRHLTPTVDYLDTVTFLRSPAVVRVSLGGQTWDQAVPEGLHESIIYVPQSNPPSKPGEVIAGPNSYPRASAHRSVTAVKQFSQGTPQVQVVRDGKVLGTLTSKVPFLADGVFQDLTLIGDQVTIASR